MDKVNILTLLAARGLGVPVVVSERNDPSMSSIGRGWDFLRRRTYSKASALVLQSPATLAFFDFLSSSKKHVIPNPVMPPPTPLNEAESRQPFGAKYFIAAMGRLVEQKGFDLLLAAFAAVSNKYPDWSLVILGEGPLRKELENQVESLKLGTRVQLAGQVSNPYPMLRRADLFVISSRFEGFPNALLEAMATGLPVVGFDCPSGPRNIIREGVDGLLVPPEDVGALAAALDRLMGNPAERERLAKHAPEVLERFGMCEIMAKWDDLIAQVRQ
jgi:glycosyltransferase involved in cell wall biosynthesis